jgi:hypothetical protein
MQSVFRRVLVASTLISLVTGPVSAQPTPAELMAARSTGVGIGARCAQQHPPRAVNQDCVLCVIDDCGDVYDQDILVGDEDTAYLFLECLDGGQPFCSKEDDDDNDDRDPPHIFPFPPSNGEHHTGEAENDDYVTLPRKEPETERFTQPALAPRCTVDFDVVLHPDTKTICIVGGAAVTAGLVTAACIGAANGWHPGGWAILTGVAIAAVVMVAIPPTTTYGGEILSTGQAVDPACNARGGAFGDPHLTTLDGVQYSFQAAGEFWVTRSERLSVQARFEPVGPSTSVTTALGFSADGHSYAVDCKDRTFSMDGTPTAVLPAGMSLNEARFTAQFASGDGVTIRFQAGGPELIPFCDFSLDLGADLFGQPVGLLGNLNTDPSDDFRTEDGTVLAQPVDLYGVYADNWRVKDTNESMLSYADGESPESFYLPDFPDEGSASDFAVDPESSEVICGFFGVEGATLAACIEDFARTGDLRFVMSAQNAALSGIAGFIELVEGELVGPNGEFIETVVGSDANFSSGEDAVSTMDNMSWVPIE